CRSPLGSFKALGAPIALVRLVKRLRRTQELDPQGLVTGCYASELADLTVISATDGNHGRALAAAARAIGCGCVIVLHANVDAERERAISAYGARIVRIAGNYDESVVCAAQLAQANGWYVVSDTSYDGYEAIPRDVMQGYGVIAAEAAAQAAEDDGRPFTHVFLQGGVGGLAAGVASYLWERDGVQRPRFVVVEPRQADCLYQSALAGRATKATGSVDSVMAGLACGEASPLAWDFLEMCIDYFMLIDDEDAVQAMRGLAAGSARDVPVVAGESGAAGVAGLDVLMRDPALARQVGLDANARVLAINTEGATAPSVYRHCVGETADAVLARQRDWLSRVAVAA
ncbi:TPA: diaminopropionate ammonia-lyase, partial [Burkholderia cenocepacia]